MTFADSVLRLVGLQVPADDPTGAAEEAYPDEPAGAGLAVSTAARVAAAAAAPSDPAAADAEDRSLGDLQAAVALVESGLATRVVLAGFPTWPGLLWQAYELAREANVVILPTVVRPGGGVDIVIARDAPADG